MNSSGGYIFVFDTETTGLPPRGVPPSEKDKWNQCRIVQIAWEIYHPMTEELIARECFTIKPDNFEIPQRAAEIHGITTERAREEGVDIHVVFDALKVHIPSIDTVVAHNIVFDNNVLLAELHRYDQLDLVSTWTCKKKECTMLMAKSKKWPKLIELYQRLFGAEDPGVTLHRADADVAICAKCYFALRKMRGA